MSKLKVGTRVVVTKYESSRFGQEGTVVPDDYAPGYSRVEFEDGRRVVLFSKNLAVVVVTPKSERDILVETFNLASVEYSEAVADRRAAQRVLEARAKVRNAAASALNEHDAQHQEKFSDKLNALGHGAQVVNRLTGATLVKLVDGTWIRTTDGERFNSVDFDMNAGRYTIRTDGVHA